MKRVLGGDEYYNLEPFAYPWAHEFYLKMHKNHWLPTEIGMGQDLLDFRSLTHAERHVVENVLSTLTTMDLMAAINFSRYATGMTTPKITAPEIQQTLFWQAAQETIHSWSYKVLLDTLQLEPDDIYMRYRTEPAIAQKIELAQHYMDADIPFVEKYFFFAAIFEGIWFFHGFTPIFSINRRGKMKGTQEQLNYILRDENVHVSFGLSVLRQINKEAPFTINHLAMFDAALDAERVYIDFILEKPILGYNAADHMEQCRYLANRRCRFMNWEEPYPGAECPFPWLDHMSGGVQKEVNFFEGKVQEYQRGGLQWDD